MPANAAQRPRLVFAHANGFPGLSYRSLLNPLAETLICTLWIAWVTTLTTPLIITGATWWMSC